MNDTKNVVFLDFDGVLNVDRPPKKPQLFAPTTISALNRLLVTADAKFVISSNWKRGADLPDLLAILKRVGVDTKRCIGATPSKLSSTHGQEIAMWLADWFEKEKSKLSWVALDDLFYDEMAPLPAERIVKTDPRLGLTEDDTDSALRILRTPYDDFRVFYSHEDEEFVGACALYPSLSHLDSDADKALSGIRALVKETIDDSE
jgi:hypothetical protein